MKKKKPSGWRFRKVCSIYRSVISRSGQAAVHFVIGLHILIESGSSRLHIRSQPKAADTQGTLQTKVLALSASTTLPFAKIKASGNGFTISRSFTRDNKPLTDGDVLHVGDKIVATYKIWNEENRSFVRLTAPRPAAFRPVQQLSGRYGWFGRPISITGWVAFSPQGYRSVLADRTEFWFDSYPEEKTSFSEEFFVTQEGTFQSPVPVIESLYAPHYRANDDGHPAVTVVFDLHSK